MLFVYAKKLLQVVMLTAVSHAINADVYKWVDEEGTIHYGDKPQAENNTLMMELDEAASGVELSDETRDEKRQRVTESLEEDRLARKEAREKKNHEREVKRRECNRLRDQQKRMQHATGLYRLDEAGNRVFLSNEQRRQSEQRLYDQIKKACS